MASWTTWKCDGCDEEKRFAQPVDKEKTDWHLIKITFDGFVGYPVPKENNGTCSYELCPNCQRTLMERANPRKWGRVEKGDA